MQKLRYKVLINWSGEVLEFYTVTTSANQALRNAIRQCSDKVGMSVKYVRDYVMDANKRRWEVKS